MEDERKRTRKEAPPLATAEHAHTPTSAAADDDCQKVCIDKWPEGTASVSLKPSAAEERPVAVLWKLLQRRARGNAFTEYKAFIDEVLCTPTATHLPLKVAMATAVPSPVGTDGYQLLRTATEAYLLARTPTLGDLAKPTDNDNKDLGAALTTYLGASAPMLPFIDRITRTLGDEVHEENKPKPFFCQDRLTAAVLEPQFLELIWSYWIEEGMVVQSINALSLRFQNKRGPGERDPLANLEIHYLRPLANLLWGYVQDEDHRLTIARRAYEYEHEYGLTLVGKAVPQLRPADRRSKFLEAFHSLLHEAAVFYEKASNLTVRADGFPLLNALREVHLILAEGAHNQFRDLPWTARVEMLIQQWILSRPEVRDFLGGRQAVPYAEDWMSPVDAMRKLMGWGDTSVTHFRDLAVNGEQIVLSIRFGDWSDVNDEEEARGWVEAWRPEIQRYIHAYQAVTGVDLIAMSADRQIARQINAVPPSVLLQRRLAQEKARG
ncbi:MAG TPA: hypothetical protein VF883_01660 [Thermoanaerobaculia bacterium]|jgi:hypothetical protein